MEEGRFRKKQNGFEETSLFNQNTIWILLLRVKRGDNVAKKSATCLRGHLREGGQSSQDIPPSLTVFDRQGHHGHASRGNVLYISAVKSESILVYSYKTIAGLHVLQYIKTSFKNLLSSPRTRLISVQWRPRETRMKYTHNTITWLSTFRLWNPFFLLQFWPEIWEVRAGHNYLWIIW